MLQVARALQWSGRGRVGRAGSWKNDFFNNSPLRAKNSEDPDSFKVRRAKVGGYRDDLTAEQAEWVAQQVRDNCDPRLGYSAA